jgi:hypothetical protein
LKFVLTTGYLLGACKSPFAFPRSVSGLRYYGEWRLRTCSG